jgi:hypothetical protein
MKLLNTIVVAASMATMSASAYADTIQISVDQDVTLKNTQPDTNWGGAPFWLWTGDNDGDRDYQNLFGFDMSSLTNSLNQGEQLVINSMSFNAYHSWGEDNGAVNIGIGNNDSWDEYQVTYNTSGNDHGGTIASQQLSGVTLNSYISWDVSSTSASEFTSDSYITFHMFIPNPGDGNNWHNFEPMERPNSSNAAFLNIDYSVVAVPEPSTYALMFAGIGLVGFMVARRRK